MGLEILVLSEDRGQGFETMEALLRRVLKIYGPTGEEQVTLIPAEDRMVQEAAHANLWKSASKQDYPRKVSLIRTIATRLALGLVIFHYDGDTPWSDRFIALTPKQFEKEVRVKLLQLLAGRDSEFIGKCMARLIEAAPFYSVEAWTYQATDAAVALCRKRYSGKDVNKFEQWASDRSLLDEVPKPKDETCLSNKHNVELAQQIPCKEVLAVRKSYAEFVRRLRSCPELAPFLRGEIGATEAS